MDELRKIDLNLRDVVLVMPHWSASTTFANNDNWHDDVSDGPVYARLVFADGKTLDAEPGFVVVTPPNFAPGLFGVVTMADVVRDL